VTVVTAVAVMTVVTVVTVVTIVTQLTSLISRHFIFGNKNFVRSFACSFKWIDFDK